MLVPTQRLRQSFLFLTLRHKTTVYVQFTTSLGVFALSVFFGYVLHLAAEAPVIQLEKLIFEPTKDKKASETNGKPFFAADSEKSQL